MDKRQLFALTISGLVVGCTSLLGDFEIAPAETAGDKVVSHVPSNHAMQERAVSLAHTVPALPGAAIGLTPRVMTRTMR